MTEQDARDTTGAHVALMIGARLVAGLLSAVIGLMVPRILGKAEYGDYGIAIGMAATLVVLSDLGLTTSAARAIAQGKATASVLRRIALVRAASALVFGAVLGVTGLALSGGSSERLGTFLQVAGLVVVASSGLGVAMGLLPTLRRVRGLLALTVAQPLLELLGISVALAVGFGGRGVIIGTVLAATFTGVAGLVLVARAIRSRTADADPESVRTVARYGSAMFLVAIAFTVFGQVDQLVIYVLRGPDEAGTYIATWRLVTLLHMVGLAAATIVAPRLAGGGPRARLLFDGWLRSIATGYLIVAAIAAAMAPVAVPAALGDKYAEGAWLLAALSGYALLLGVAPLITMAANFLGGARSRIRIGFITIAVNLVLDLLLVPTLGYYGAAISTTIAFGWYVGAHLRLTWQLLGPVPALPADVVVPGSLGFGLLWAMRSVGAAAIAAGVAGIGVLVLEPAVGGVLAVLASGAVAMAAGALIAWGHPRNAAPVVPVVSLETFPTTNLSPDAEEVA